MGAAKTLPKTLIARPPTRASIGRPARRAAVVMSTTTRLASPEIALPEYRNRCGIVKNVSGPTSPCHWMSQVSPISEITDPASTVPAGTRPVRSLRATETALVPPAVRSIPPTSLSLLDQQRKNVLRGAGRPAQ